MKKILLLIFLTLSVFASNSINQTLGYASSYEKAISKAKKQHKDVMLVIVTDYCPWCRKMENFTLKKASIKKEVQKNYIAVILHRSKKKFPTKFDTPRIPTIFFIDPYSENAYWESIGYKNRKDFLLEIKEAKSVRQSNKKKR